MDVVTNPCSRFNGVPVNLCEDSDHQFYYFSVFKQFCYVANFLLFVYSERKCFGRALSSLPCVWIWSRFNIMPNIFNNYTLNCISFELKGNKHSMCHFTFSVIMFWLKPNSCNRFIQNQCLIKPTQGLIIEGWLNLNERISHSIRTNSCGTNMHPMDALFRQTYCAYPFEHRGEARFTFSIKVFL